MALFAMACHEMYHGGSIKADTMLMSECREGRERETHRDLMSH